MELVGIASTRPDTVERMNGTANGFQIGHKTIKQYEVSKSNNAFRSKSKEKTVESAIQCLDLSLLAEARPYSFITPLPDLAVNNDDKREKDEWNLIDERKNNTDDTATKRILLFIYSYISFACNPYIFLTFLVIGFRVFCGD